MTTDSLNHKVILPIAGFLMENLPTHLDEEGNQIGWDHNFGSAYEMGCEALAALGYATETAWGAVPLLEPTSPTILPRWDDVCVAILGLAHQRDKLSYRLLDGTVPTKDVRGHAIRPSDVQPPPAPNIAASCGLGPAYADRALLILLQKLDLIDENGWTSAAETVLWREEPYEWSMEFESDSRFAVALENTVHKIPEDIRKELNRLAVISEDEIEQSLLKRRIAAEKAEVSHPPRVLPSAIQHMFVPVPMDNQLTLRAIVACRISELRWLFFRRWRLPNGWLLPQEEARALEIFHDPLAIAMSHKVIARLYPDSPLRKD